MVGDMPCASSTRTRSAFTLAIFQACEPTVKVADHHSIFRAFEGMGRTETSEHGGGTVPSVP